MKRYTATATREGRWWVIDVDGVGVTQARSVREAHEMVDDLVRVLRDDTDFEIEIHFLVDKLDATVLAQTVRGKVRMAEVAQRDAAEANREAARRLSAAGVSGGDIAGILEVSPQRVSQLLHS
jgi:hypothetical protein